MTQITVVKPFWHNSSVWYGTGQFNVAAGMARNPWVQTHLKDGKPDPPGTPFTDPGDAIFRPLPPPHRWPPM
jgi:hypothetical protein